MKCIQIVVLLLVAVVIPKVYNQPLGELKELTLQRRGTCSGSSKVKKAEISKILQEHNRYRSEVRSPGLTWDNDLAIRAQNLADTCRWGHAKLDGCGSQAGKKLGQNIYAHSAWEAKGGVAGGIEAWGEEKHDWTGPKYPGSCSKVCGHYTQIVWKATKKVGCGYKKCSNFMMGYDMVYFVCDYFPAGNYYGKDAF